MDEVIKDKIDDTAKNKDKFPTTSRLGQDDFP